MQALNIGLWAKDSNSAECFLNSHSCALYTISQLLGRVKPLRIICMYFLQKFSGLFLWLFTPNPFPVTTFSLRISMVVEQKKGSSKCSQQS